MEIYINKRPDEDWQEKIHCHASVIENEITENHKCDFCESEKTFSINPMITLEIRYHPQIKEEIIERRIRNTLEKVYKDRYVCECTECRRKFRNDTWALINKKEGYSV